MAVWIYMLSGARQGEHLELHLPEFRAGADPGCDVVFDPAADPAAQGSAAQFRLEADGWTVKNVGAVELLINDRPAFGRTRLRSGDVLRLSALGPSFSFNLLARATGTAPAPSRSQAAPANAPTASGAASVATSPAAAVERLPTIRSGPATGAWVAVAAAVGAVLLAAYFIGQRFWPPAPANRDIPAAVAQANDETKSGDPPSDAAASASSDSQQSETASPEGETPQVDKSSSSPPPEEPADEDNVPDDAPRKPIPPEDAWTTAATELRSAVLLLAVEEPKSQTQWPFATATAIGEKTLLTSATVAQELARFRQRGWKLWALHESAGIMAEIVDERVHAGFARSAGQPELQVYADLGVLSVGGGLPPPAALAGAGDLDEIAGGQPLACLAIVHDDEPINRFQTYLPQLTRGKLFILTSLPPSPGGPRLAHVRMTLPMKVYGSPVFNESGRVVGVFAESAAHDDEAATAGQAAADLNVHYVPLVDLVAIRAWLESQDETWWVKPTVAPEATPAETAPAKTTSS